MASNASSMWLTDSDSCYAESGGSSTSSSSYNNPPAFAALTPAVEQRTPSPEPPQPHGPRQAGPSLLSQGIAEMRTLQATAAGKEKFLPSNSKSNTNPSPQAANNGKSTSTIKFPSSSQLQAQRREAIARAEQARIDDETRRAAKRVKEREAVLRREMEQEIYVSGMCFMDMSGERRDTENAGGWDSREWVCCGCEVYNSGYEFLCSHCRVHTKCGECERREQGWFKLEGGEKNEDGESCFQLF